MNQKPDNLSQPLQQGQLLTSSTLDRISTQESDSDPKDHSFDQKRKDQDLNTLKMTEQDFRIFNKVFDEMDINSNGSVSQDEFEKVLRIYYKESSLAQDYVDINFNAIDKDHNGSITLFEFLYGIEQGHCPLLVNLVDMIGKEEENAEKFQKLEKLKKDQLLFDDSNPIPYARDVLRMPEFQRNKYQKAFSLIDLDNSGRITRLEFDIIVRHFGLIKPANPEDISELYNMIDVDGSGEITLLEFWNCLGGNKPLKKLAAMVDTILKKEKDILSFIQKQGIKRMTTPMPVPNKAKIVVEDEKDVIRRNLEAKIMELEKGFMGQIEEMNEVIGQKDGEIGRLGGLLKEKSEENVKIVEAKVGLEKKIEEFEKELVVLRDDKKRLAEKEIEINGFSRRIQDFEKEKSVLQETLKVQNTKLESLKAEHSELNGKFVSVELENKDLREVESELKSRVDVLEKIKEDLTVDLTKSQNELEKAQGSNQGSLKELERLNHQLSTMISIEEFNKLIKEKGDTKDLTENLLASESGLKQEKSRLEAENNTLKERMSQLEKYKQETVVEIAKLTTHLEDAKARVVQGEHEIQQLNGRVFNLGTENGQLKEKAGQFEKYKEETVAEITKLNASLEGYKTRVAENQLEIQKLNNRVATMTSQEEIEKLKKEISSLVYQVESSNKDISILKDQKSSIEAEKTRLSEQLRVLEKQKEEELASNIKLGRELSEEKLTIAGNMGEIRSLKEKISTISNELDNLKKEKEDLLKENESLKKSDEPMTYTRDNETVRTLTREGVQDGERAKKVGYRNMQRFEDGDLEYVQVPTHSPMEEIERLNNVIANMVSREEVFRILSERDGMINEFMRFKDGIFRSVRMLSWVNGLRFMK